ncbi:MAG: histidine phosphatase family protein [Clostridiales bacterium]|nr:histidine phosphatase family protein [Clostridiales bacterium]
MYLYLVRHGQSTGNERQLFFGVRDYPLTELGREQAKQAADKLREVEFTRCVSSPLSRAWDTAMICAEGRFVVPEACPALREQDMGELEGLTWGAAEARFGDQIGRLLSDWFHTAPPGGEPPQQMLARVGGCVDGLIRRGEDTLVAAHNGSLSLILYHLGLVGERELLQPDWFFRHGTYSAIRVDENGAQLVHFNR